MSPEISLLHLRIDARSAAVREEICSSSLASRLVRSNGPCSEDCEVITTLSVWTATSAENMCRLRGRGWERVSNSDDR